MTRHRRDDRDEPEIEYDHGTRGVPTSILIFGVLVLLLIGGAVVGGVWFAFTARQQAREAVAMHEELVAREQAARESAEYARQLKLKPRNLAARGIEDAPAPISRDDFKAKVMGKTPNEVLQALGQPDSTQDGNNPGWLYEKRTFDPVSRKTDTHVQIIFRAGTVAIVDFS